LDPSPALVLFELDPPSLNFNLTMAFALGRVTFSYALPER
jgi:hypothetical protein